MASEDLSIAYVFKYGFAGYGICYDKAVNLLLDVEDGVADNRVVQCSAIAAVFEPVFANAKVLCSFLVG